MLDVFKTNPDAFSVISLTDNIESLKYQPGHIGSLGIFAETGITTLTAMIEERDGILQLITPTPRGGPGDTITKSVRTARSIAVPHFEINDGIYADEVQSVRAWGSENDVETVQGKITERQVIHTQSMEATIEYARIGAVKGIITYADSSTLDLFSFFGVTQEAEVDFDLDNANPASGALRTKCASVARTIANNLGGVGYTGILAECGDTFFDQLVANVEVVNSYKNTDMAAVLRQPYLLPGNPNLIYGAFEFGGIVFYNYRGSVGSTAFIDPLKCHVFPTGVSGLFRSYMAPADYSETVNTVGKRIYTKQYPFPNDKGYHLDSQSNILSICTRPKVLIKGKNT